MENDVIMWPDSLLIDNDMKAELENLCDNILLRTVLRDMNECSICIHPVDGHSCWDVTKYLDQTSNVSQDDKAKIIYAFSLLGGSIILDGEKVIGDSNLTSKLIQTKRISQKVGDYLINVGYTKSCNIDCKIE